MSMRRDDDRDRPLFMISVAAELAGMHPQTLRLYERRGLVHPQRTAKNTRRYSRGDVERLQRIQELTELGLNLAGVERVLVMEQQLTAMQSEMARLQTRLDEAASAMRREVERVERSHRLDLVPVTHTQVVRLGRRRRRA
jgi:MerR family transcriptional regulator, heat shock protein HspR